jgi:Cys-tRNA(Pro)/Cys-tRNA(Cys) deacylase
MKKNEEKTNVMRVLDSKKIKYNSFTYLDSGVVSGIEVARVIGQNPDMVFKTLVTEGASKKNYVFLVPVEKELDLKKAAKTVGEKSVSMIKSKELLPLTGYIHGGCSPIGMKKLFKTVIHSTANEFEAFFVSAGRVGRQIETNPEALAKLINARFEDIII